ncbi:MAG TPA: TonB-dependent receptor, partial [Bacteroidetes bacterium]|nr:TonB-dependent receptor [Bacteroidota bacterium]
MSEKYFAPAKFFSMPKSIFSFLFLFASINLSSNLFANSKSFRSETEGAISGVVTDAETSEPLIGATVAVLNTTNGTITDFDGKFILTNVPEGKCTIKVSYIGYESKEIPDVTIEKGQTLSINVSLSEKKENTLNEVVITTELKRENVSSMLSIRKSSAVVSDAISADMIKKSPDKNTSEVLKRVSGITIQENKFVVVRGMNDRYNTAMLNGALLPS